MVGCNANESDQVPVHHVAPPFIIPYPLDVCEDLVAKLKIALVLRVA